jgi:hypothetical protein
VTATDWVKLNNAWQDLASGQATKERQQNTTIYSQLHCNSQKSMRAADFAIPAENLFYRLIGGKAGGVQLAGILRRLQRRRRTIRITCVSFRQIL